MKTYKWLSAFLIISVAFVVTFTVCGYKGDEWENSIRKIYYQHLLQQPVPATYSVHTNTYGVPYVIYHPTAGTKTDTQYLPTTVGIYALQYFASYQSSQSVTDRQYFFNCINLLKRNVTYLHGAGFYRFGWQQPYYEYVSPPWVSALANGKAIEALIAARQISTDTGYLFTAFDLLRAFYIPVERGGFTIKSDTGWWYEEYAGTTGSTPQVMNGHAYAVLSVYRLWQLTQSDSAKYIFDKGVAALLNNISKYDAGNGWSYYDLQKKKADKQYHRIAVELMQRFYQITGNEKFNFYYQKWNQPFQQPYVVRIVKEKNRSGMVLFSAILSLCCLLLLPLYWLGRNMLTKKSNNVAGS